MLLAMPSKATDLIKNFLVEQVVRTTEALFITITQQQSVLA
jgi:hypothetical protein